MARSVKVELDIPFTALLRDSFPEYMRECSLGDDGRVWWNYERNGPVELGEVIGRWELRDD